MAAMHTQETTSRWSSRWAFVLATAGAAVGLGNIWRFPYMAGLHGGSAFVILYCLCVLGIGLPVMLAEILIGRLGRRNPIDALEVLALQSDASAHWRFLGVWGAFGLLLVLSFYSVVAGWSLAYLGHACTVGFSGWSAGQVSDLWAAFVANPKAMLACHSLFMLLTVSVISLGVKSGLERTTRYIMPLLYLVLMTLVVYAAAAADFAKAWHFLFDFRWQDVNANVVLAAMGHAFFTLAIGAGALLTYGAYAPREVNLASAIAWVVILDVLVALLSGLAIFPWVFNQGLSPASGPGLMFEVLPTAFAHVDHGNLLAILFFCLLFFAAWTSSINIAEPLVAILMERYGWARHHAAVLVGLCAWLLGFASVFSWNLWASVKLFGQWNLFDGISSFATDWVLPIGGFGFAWFIGHTIRQSRVVEALPNMPPVLLHLWLWVLRYVTPIGVLIIFLEPLIKNLH